jgi:hypothetical protein
MAETVTVDGPTVAKRAATVSASALALHLDCSRAYVGKLEAGGVIQRRGDGFPLDHSRVACLRYLRRERRQSPRSQADADHVTADKEKEVDGSPGRIRTSDQPVNSRLLYH